MIIEFLYQLLQRKDLAIRIRRPAKQCNKIDDRLRKKALFDQILIGGIAASLGKLLVIGIGNQRAVNVLRNLPAKGLIQTIVLRTGGNIFVSANDMRDSHQMIIDHVCEIIGREAVRLDEDHVIELAVVYRDVSVKLIVEGRGALSGIVLTNDKRLSCRKIGFHLFFGK